MNKKYDVVLIVPPVVSIPKKNTDNIYEHLGVGYLISSLPENVSATYIDAYNFNYEISEILDYISILSPKIVGVSCNFSDSVKSTIEIAEAIREAFPQIHISCGGHGIIPYKEEVIFLGIMDSICLCEGELCFPQFVQKFIENKDYTQTDGMWFYKNPQVVKNSSMPLTKDLDIIKWPVRIDGINRISLPEIYDNAVYTVISSRGCPYTCKFCDIKSFYGDHRGDSWRMRSAENLVNEIEYLVNEKDAKFILIGDDNFIGSCPKGFKRAFDFCRIMKERNLDIYFGIEARVTDMNFNLLKELKDVGLKSVMLGVENATTKTLERWNKKINVDDSYKAIKMLNRLGIHCFVNYILYDMYSTIEEIEESAYFFKKSGIYRQDYPINLFDNKLGLFIGTELTEEMKQTDLLVEERLSVGKKGFEIINYSYQYQDSRMVWFDKLQMYWVKKVRNFRDSLNPVDKKTFDLTCGVMLMRNMEICIDLAKNKNFNGTLFIEGRRLLDENINMYLKRSLERFR